MKETELLKSGGVGVIPTDTLYGLVACALHEEAVRRIYELKERTPTKPCIILISSLDDLALFGVTLTAKRQKILSDYWPGPVSIILPCGKSVHEYLHRGTSTLAFRVPADARLRSFLQESGPLAAPSANPEGLPPATTITEARSYFGDTVDFYLDGGTLAGNPSTLIAIGEDGTVTILRT